MIQRLLNLEREDTRTVLKIFEFCMQQKNKVYVVWNDKKWVDINGRQILAQVLDEASNEKICPHVGRANGHLPLPKGVGAENGLALAGDTVGGISMLGRVQAHRPFQC